MAKRIILIVLDSVGIGELPDADLFGDVGSNTLGHIAEQLPGFRLPHLQGLGLGNIRPETGLDPVPRPAGSFGYAAERSLGKDTTTGHWEIAGLVLEQPFRTFPDGFPDELMQAFEERIGRGTLGNVVASGTVIINELGDEHVRTGKPIVYTSADSVFQIAAHEDVIPIEEQYRINEIARELCTGEYAVGRVIARPFVGSKSDYARTSNRRDFSLVPPGKTVFKLAQESGLPVMAVGKMNDIYAGDGITDYVKTKDNMDGVDKTLAYLRNGPDQGIILTNLVDFDMLYGHRRDLPGYARCLEEFDARMPEIVSSMLPEDVLIITADHGNDPSFKGTDHTREYIPILIGGSGIPAGRDIGRRDCFADIGATIADMLGLPATPHGRSFASMLSKTPVG